MLLRLPRLLLLLARTSPATTGYLLLLLLTHAWLTEVASPATAARTLLAVSTNIGNLQRDPIGSLAGSALFFDGTLTHVRSLEFAGTVITLGMGVAVCLVRLESRYGAWRACAVFLAGHVGATLFTACVIEIALRCGWYPESVRHALDYGISYGAQAALAASAVLVRRRSTSVVAMAAVIAWPVAGAEWNGPLPDFTTVGHLSAAAVGFLAGVLLERKCGLSVWCRWW
ncbi:rhomboid-like protein [Streptomyces sp. NPDC050619]|uniref:rhomboid-like protein n=1 Tax=Streptomyces sp. NPDC050619 TaxID=3157214 RepID=UPI003444F781